MGSSKKKEERLKSIRSRASEGGLLLENGSVWRGAERRTSRLLKEADTAKKKCEEHSKKDPCSFFG